MIWNVLHQNAASTVVGQILEILYSIAVSTDHVLNTSFVPDVVELELVGEFVILKVIPDLTNKEASLLDKLGNVQLQVLAVKPFNYRHL